MPRRYRLAIVIFPVLLLIFLHLLFYTCNIQAFLRKDSVDKFREPNMKYYSQDEINFLDERIYNTRQVHTVKCNELFAGNVTYINTSKELATGKHNSLTISGHRLFMEGCRLFVFKRCYITDWLTKEEREFPIAYSIVFYKDVEQTERLLRAIYRPQNFYCIHIDKKAKTYDKETIKFIASCFENVFLASPLINVEWGKYSVLQAEITCMQQLVKKSRWKYFINLTGQEFPLKTNYEIVKILQAYNGANDIDGVRHRQFDFRWKNISPPHNAIPTIGAVHIAANRDFVEYIVNNQTAKEILKWAKNVHIPDEIYFSTLNNSPKLGIKGSYKGAIPTDEKEKRKDYIARFKNWGEYPCAGKFVHHICIFGIGDLPLLKNRRELFANKFHLDFEPFSLDCLDELIFNRTRDEYLHITKFDSTLYSNLDFVKNKIR